MSISHNLLRCVSQFALASFSLLFATLLFTTTAWSAEKLPILNVSDISGWETKIFAGDTLYSKSNMGGRSCIKAESRQSASGMFKNVRIDLTKTPIIHWDWYVQNTLGDIDETNKDGDDYAARLYVVISGGVFFWNTRALNYVWASQQPKASSWPNAFSSNASMVAVESGADNTGKWRHQTRNVLEDIKNILMMDVRFIDAVAIMTDTDNSGKQATACYGEIYFAQH